MSRISQIGALAALEDQAWLQETRRKVATSRDAIAAIARQNGLEPLPSATNFLTIDCGRDGTFARKVLQELIARDVFVRMPFVAPHDRCIRISCGGSQELDVLEKALPPALAAARC
jgi:histidinol-phosphate aminotransferase